MLFVLIALLFWAIMSLNDNMQGNVDVKINIYNVPDTVTFINDPPDMLHVTVRDKGTHMLRQGVLQTPTLDINFGDFSSDGRFRFSHSDVTGSLRALFGPAAQIGSISVDSISLRYTDYPGRRIPVEVAYDVTAASGKIVDGRPRALPSAVTVYSTPDILDTLTRIFTRKVKLRDLNEPTQVEIDLSRIPGAKIVPGKVTVKVPVEPLVKKESMVTVKADNVPPGKDILFFPAKVRVEYFVPMSRFSGDTPGLEVRADYNEAMSTTSDRVGIVLMPVPRDVINPHLTIDSVEYTLVKER